MNEDSGTNGSKYLFPNEPDREEKAEIVMITGKPIAEIIAIIISLEFTRQFYFIDYSPEILLLGLLVYWISFGIAIERRKRYDLPWFGIIWKLVPLFLVVLATNRFDSEALSVVPYLLLPYVFAYFSKFKMIKRVN